MVLSHLVLNDMMKVKGHVSGLAKCLVDPDDRIQALAQLFFHELARKEHKQSNPVYNLLPDIISNLSKDASLEVEAFRCAGPTRVGVRCAVGRGAHIHPPGADEPIQRPCLTRRRIMEHLLQFIQKDRQTEGLVEKLLQRFPGTTSAKEWRDIAFCLAQLSFSDKGIKKLSEHIKVPAARRHCSLARSLADVPPVLAFPSAAVHCRPRRRGGGRLL